MTQLDLSQRWTHALWFTRALTGLFAIMSPVWPRRLSGLPLLTILPSCRWALCSVSSQVWAFLVGSALPQQKFSGHIKGKKPRGLLGQEPQWGTITFPGKFPGLPKSQKSCFFFFSVKGQRGSVSDTAGQMGLFCNYSTLLLRCESRQRQSVNKWVWLCCNKTLFIKTHGCQDLPHRL